MSWDWPRIAPYYDDLLARALTAENVAEWLSDWTAIGERLDEADIRFTIRTTVNTADEDVALRYRRFVDEVQPQVTASEQLVDRFWPHVDWSGLEREKRAYWHRQRHVFTDPFYYIEYGMALLGAVQLFASARRDQREAVAAYRRALALGATAPVPDLYAAAGLRFAFDAAILREAVDVCEQVIAELEPVAGS